MGLMRYLLGLARDSVDFRTNTEERQMGRRALATRLGQQLTPPATRRGPTRRPLYPASWRLVQHRPQHSTAILRLADHSPQPVADPPAAESIDADVVVITSAPAGAAQQFGCPPGWSAAQRLIAAANSGILDSYDRLIIVDHLLPAAADVQHALALLVDPHIGGLAKGVVQPQGDVFRSVSRILKSRHWPTPHTQCDVPSGLDLVSRAFLAQGLRALRLAPDDFGAGARGEEVLAALLGVLAAEAGMPICDVTASAAVETAREPLAPRIVPFYLPQFHPTKENDSWWGKGFTEWTNTATAVPHFKGHFQPKLPADLGYYDLRLDEVRAQQAKLARQAGIGGLMYYHYWFAGRRLLGEPIDRLVNQRDLDQPFCLMWANEDWARSWDGDPKAILIRQDYDRVPARTFIEHVLVFLRDDRYLTVDGRKLLAVYRPGSIPDFADVADAWRERARAEGIELLLVGVEYVDMGPEVQAALDATMAFPPHRKKYVPVNGATLLLDRDFSGGIFSYSSMVDDDIAGFKIQSRHHFPGVMTSWDNTPRRGTKAHLWLGANPYTYRRWLLAAAESVMDRPESERVVFVNAWNEWAEGAVLEPSNEWGHAYLCATRDVANG
ncbi:hypothetical protein GCM10027599_10990 [Yimella radicis]